MVMVHLFPFPMKYIPYCILYLFVYQSVIKHCICNEYIIHTQFDIVQLKGQQFRIFRPSINIALVHDGLQPAVQKTITNTFICEFQSGMILIMGQFYHKYVKPGFDDNQDRNIAAFLTTASTIYQSLYFQCPFAIVFERFFSAKLSSWAGHAIGSRRA